MLVMSLWSIEAFLVIPVGIVSIILLLSDIRGFQRIAMSLCSIKLTLGRLTVSASFVFAFISTIICIIESVYTIPALTGGRYSGRSVLNTTTTTLEMADRIRMKEWRNDRNWWISLYACTIWLIVWRLQVWTNRYCFTQSAGQLLKGKSEGTQKETTSSSPPPKLLIEEPVESKKTK